MELKDARTKAGISVEEASKRTRIPARYLEALEEGDLSVFPPGPFLSGYTKQYRAFLGLPESVPAPPTPRGLFSRPDATPLVGHAGGLPASPSETPPGGAGSAAGPGAEAASGRSAGAEAVEPGAIRRPRPGGAPPAPPRRTGRAMAIGAAALAGILLAVRLGEFLWGGDEVALGVPPDQVLRVTPVEPVHATVKLDDKDAFDGMLHAGKERTFAAHDRIEINLGSLDGVTFSYNNRPLKPLGAQGLPRRLVFIDDTPD